MEYLHVDYDSKNRGITFPFSHQHVYYEIYLLDQGRRTIIIDQKMYPTTGGDVAMILPQKQHRSFGDTPYSGLCITFTHAYIKTYFSEVAASNLLTCFHCPIIHLTKEEQTKLHSLAAELLQKDKTSTRFVCCANILALLSCASKRISLAPPSYDLPALNPILNYIQTHLCEITGLDEIANAIHLNKNYLCGLFKKQTGITIFAYINTLRIQYACTLLMESYETIEEISCKCGYTSSSYFCRMFKKLVNCTPKEYRKQMEC